MWTDIFHDRYDFQIDRILSEIINAEAEEQLEKTEDLLDYLTKKGWMK